MPDTLHPIHRPQSLLRPPRAPLHLLQMPVVVRRSHVSIRACIARKFQQTGLMLHCAHWDPELTLSHSLGPIISRASVRCPVNEVDVTLQHSVAVPLGIVVVLDGRIGGDMRGELVKAVYMSW